MNKPKRLPIAEICVGMVAAVVAVVDVDEEEDDEDVEEEDEDEEPLGNSRSSVRAQPYTNDIGVRQKKQYTCSGGSMGQGCIHSHNRSKH
jgi:hypothetical protein